MTGVMVVQGRALRAEDIGHNLAETGHSMMKVPQKISGLFRSEAGAQAFCRIRSHISTARQHTMGALDAIARVFTGDPFVPSLDTS